MFGGAQGLRAKVIRAVWAWGFARGGAPLPGSRGRAPGRGPRAKPPENFRKICENILMEIDFK